MLKIKLLSLLAAPFLFLPSYASYATTPVCQSQKEIKYIRYDDDKTYIGLNDGIEDIYTDKISLRAPLTQAYYLGEKITVYVHSNECRSSEKFSEFNIGKH